MKEDDDSVSVVSSASGPNNSISNDDSSHTPTSGSVSTTTGTSHTGSNRAGGIPEDILASKETRAVHYSRIMVLTVLFLSATVAGIMTWYWSTESEQDDFETQFSDFALEIDDVSNHNAANVFLVTESFSTSVTSSALTMGSLWPQVTIPHMEVRGDRYRAVTNAQLVSFSPIVTDVRSWNTYSVENQVWLEEAYTMRGDVLSPDPIPEQVYRLNSDGTIVAEGLDSEEVSPLWQESEAPHDTSVINFNLLSHDVFARVFELMRDTKAAVLSEVFDPSELLGEGALTDTEDNLLHPESMLVQPVFDSFDETNRKVVGTIIAVIPWDTYFTGLLHEGANGVICVLRDTCGDVFSYRIDGPKAAYLGSGDLHEKQYNYLEHIVPFGPLVDFTDADDDAEKDHCDYSLHIFPTSDLEEEYHTNKPIIFTVVVVLIFVFTSMVFFLYDYLVQRRQDKVHSAAVKSNAIVSSLFPAEIRDRLFQQNDKGASGKNKGKGSGVESAARFRLKNYLDDGENNNENPGAIPEMYDTKPIADLFPNTTVMFADIAGFTAWSSVREPAQVFTLLETVYRAFDTIAKRRRVFKVETVGDCYVAVTGLPEPRKEHAVVMARFARDCMQRMNELSHQLEVTLGPDTGDLAMRFGLHSGPVTAGVLRGDKSRFQLFGDTVNTAARVESTGMRNRIHLSQETSNLLKEAGKEQWVVPRTDVVVAKGKGEMITFWLLPKDSATAADFNSEIKADRENRQKENRALQQRIPLQTQVSPKVQRLVDWNVDVLKRLLKLVIAKRNAEPRKLILTDSLARAEGEILNQEGMALDEVVEIVKLPKFDPKTQRNQLDPNSVELTPAVIAQLRDYVAAIACTYRENPFHNFEHASHVTMSVSKLLSRIVAPDIDLEDKNAAASLLHDHTYGITSDPLTQFAVVMSALIHDADHVGLPNFLLINENKKLAATYKQKSIAEQRSVDLAWQTLMEPRFGDLRNCLYTDTAELNRLRQLVVNTVLATDIFDKELQTIRKCRWEKAFTARNVSANKEDSVSRKATIVIEHLIQASDVAHTMQHWHIYQKWNERLFQEMYAAYKTGRSSKDPALGWYRGELGFFDNYIIPLAKKLKDCGVFGVSSDEYLNYALENRREWASKGEEVVASMVEKYYEKDDGSKGSDHGSDDEKKAPPSKGEEVVASMAEKYYEKEDGSKGSDHGSDDEKKAPANAFPYDNKVSK